MRGRGDGSFEAPLPLPGGPDPHSVAVADVNRSELIAMASELNDEDWTGGEHEFVIGTGLSIPDSNDDWDIETLFRLTHAGAHFLQVLPGYEPALLSRFLGHLVEHRVTWRCSVMVTVDLNEGIRQSAERMAEAMTIPGISGIHLLTPDDANRVEAAIETSGIKL